MSEKIKYGQCKICLEHYWTDPNYTKKICKRCCEDLKTVQKTQVWQDETGTRYYMDFFLKNGQVKTLEI